ncbi:MAG: S-layer homology domain-containing protein [Oscillospiraceae bacterium]|nr:S-layer homology domain-containing protein [Oscillospiraceae bacterium]
MKKRYLIPAAFAAVLLPAGAAAGFAATAGSAEDPLISLAYITDIYTESVRAKAKEAIDDAVKSMPAADPAQPAASLRSIAAGGSVTMRTGGTMTLISGSADISIKSGAVVNVTVGYEAVTGKLMQFHRYLACEDTSATVTFNTASVFSVEGNADIEGLVSPFADITPDRWFFGDVAAATKKGLINGKTATIYEPYGNLTVAEAIKLAACLHQLHSEGSVTLRNSDVAPWYKTYADYASEHGIISEEYADPAVSITRAEFVRIFFNVYPASGYAEINRVADNAVPDVKDDSPRSREIYVFYRAGILTGDETNRFNPEALIMRSEVAAVLTRMYDPGARVSVSLP